MEGAMIELAGQAPHDELLAARIAGGRAGTGRRAAGGARGRAQL
jgi:hypothetical protein